MNLLSFQHILPLHSESWIARLEAVDTTRQMERQAAVWFRMRTCKREEPGAICFSSRTQQVHNKRQINPKYCIGLPCLRCPLEVVDRAAYQPQIPNCHRALEDSVRNCLIMLTPPVTTPTHLPAVIKEPTQPNRNLPPPRHLRPRPQPF